MRTEAPTRVPSLSDPRELLRYLARNDFALMESFLPDLARRATSERAHALAPAFRDTVKRAKVALRWRLVVTVLLVLAGSSTAVTTAMAALGFAPGAAILVQRVATLAASVTVLLVLARFALSWYLARLKLHLTMVAILLAGGETEGAPREQGGATRATE